MSITTRIGVAQTQPVRTTWRVAEVWRVDGSEGGEPFADPRDVAVLRDGTVWLLDFNDQHIRRFAADGKPLKTIGRKGSGPGEFRNANGLLVHPDGSVWVSDPRNARLSALAPTGALVRTIATAPWGWLYRWEGWVDFATGNVADPRIADGARSWTFFSPRGEKAMTIARPSCSVGSPRRWSGFQANTPKSGSMMSEYPFTQGGGAAPNGRGAMWCADEKSRSAALVQLERGDTLATTNIDLPAVRIPKGERDSVIALLRTNLRRYATTDFDESKVPFQKPSIASLTVDDDGRLWVQQSHIFRESGPTFDVHDGRGKHLGRLTLPRPLFANGALALKSRGDALWVVTLDADGAPNLTRYRFGR